MAQAAAVPPVFVAKPNDDQYGFALSKAADLPTGTVYPVLARFEDASWVVSSWEQIDPSVEDRRPRHNYRLTDQGAVAAQLLIRTGGGRLARWCVPEFGESHS